MSDYSTGELARLCGVTVRTVQFYDARGLLHPSDLSEGGRRLYAEGDLRKMRMICALKTMGLEPMDFLVLPRMLALILMMPLLYLYANLLGMLGGGLIAVTVLGMTGDQFANQLFHAVPLSVFVTGLIKSGVFGVLVALSGCMQGINCGRSAAAVGDATTSAVVTAIVAIIIADGVFGVVAPPFSIQ